MHVYSLQNELSNPAISPQHNATSYLFSPSTPLSLTFPFNSVISYSTTQRQNITPHTIQPTSKVPRKQESTNLKQRHTNCNGIEAPISARPPAVVSAPFRGPRLRLRKPRPAAQLYSLLTHSTLSSNSLLNDITTSISQQERTQRDERKSADVEVSRNLCVKDWIELD
jgi:hypothetical protein